MEKEKKHTYDNFYDWVRHEKFAIGLALFCAFCPLLKPFNGKLFEYLKEEVHEFSFLWYIQKIFNNGYHYQIINILFIFIILYLFTRMKIELHRNDEQVEKLHKYVKDMFGENSTLARNTPAELFDRIRIGIKQFYFLWISVWVVWLIMYIVEFIYTITILHELQQYELAIVHNLFENSLNLISSFLLFFIYMDITISTVRVGTLTDNGRNTMYIGGAVLILIGAIFFTIDIFSLFLPADSYHLTQFFLRLFIGIIASMSMMAVLGRLNTSFLKIPQPFVMCLYWYATVQMLYPLTYTGKTYFPCPEILNNVLNISAFLGKGCLILVLQWITKENRFLFFLIHKANSLSDSDTMLRRFNKYYKGCPDK